MPHCARRAGSWNCYRGAHEGWMIAPRCELARKGESSCRGQYSPCSWRCTAAWCRRAPAARARRGRRVVVAGRASGAAAGAERCFSPGGGLRRLLSLQWSHSTSGRVAQRPEPTTANELPRVPELSCWRRLTRRAASGMQPAAARTSSCVRALSACRGVENRTDRRARLVCGGVTGNLARGRLSERVVTSGSTKESALPGLLISGPATHKKKWFGLAWLEAPRS